MIDWRYWHDNPPTAAALVLLGWLYFLAAGPLRARLAPGAPYPRAEARRFGAGLLLAWLAVASPLARAGELYLFSLRLALHLVLVFAASALWVSGLPAWMGDALARRPGLGGLARVLTRPLWTGSALVVMLTAWHLPRLYEASLESAAVRLAQHACLGLAGVLFWWPLLSRSPALPRARPGALMAYLFAIEVALTGVFSYLLMAEHPLYATYAAAPRMFPALAPLDDQLFAGILLSLVSSLVLVGALAATFFRWAKNSS